MEASTKKTAITKNSRARTQLNFEPHEAALVANLRHGRKVRPCSRFAGAEVERTFGLSGEKEPKKSPRRLPRAFFGLIG